MQMSCTHKISNWHGLRVGPVANCSSPRGPYRSVRLTERSRRPADGLTGRVSSTSMCTIIFIPPQYLKEGPPSVAVSKVENWSPVQAIEDMDRHEIDISVLSFSSPYL